MSHLPNRTVRPSVRSVDRAVGKQARKNCLIIDVRVLSDMIHSMGRDVLSTLDKRMLLRARRRATCGSAKEKKVGGGSGKEAAVAPLPPPPAGLTLHERRKRKIGFLGVNDIVRQGG